MITLRTLAFAGALAVSAATVLAHEYKAGDLEIDHPWSRATTAQPLISLIPTKDFFATPRGRQILLRSLTGQLGDDPAASPRLAATRQIDACLADAILSEAILAAAP